MEVAILENPRDLDRIISVSGLENHSKRIQNDFKNGRFCGLLVNEPKDQSLQGFLIYYYAYSSWQNRIIYIKEIWTSAESNRRKTAVSLVKKLILIARKNQCNRLNVNIALNSADGESLADLLACQDLGFQNLGKKEDWLIFQMNGVDMKKFASNRSITVDENKYQVIKVADMKKYAEEICELIREIAVFERLPEQFEMKPELLVRDYGARKAIDHSEQSGRFYHSWVLLETSPDGQKPRVVGYTIYYVSYDLVHGVGCYLEELYIVESHRQKGLGKFLWKKTIEDCLASYNCNYMQWTVLNWNHNAIDFYYKLNSKNLTDSQKLTLFRLVKEKIYSKE